MKPYCHMGKMCLGCSPQLIEGICPDSKAGMIVAELVGALQWYVETDEVSDMLGNEFWLEGRERARAAIAKATGGEG